MTNIQKILVAEVSLQAIELALNSEKEPAVVDLTQWSKAMIAEIRRLRSVLQAIELTAHEKLN